MTFSRHEPAGSTPESSLETVDEVFRSFEREAKSTFDTPNIGWRTAYAAICVLAMLPVSLILTRAIAKSLDGLWVGLPIAIVFSAMVVFWARRGDADARLRREVLPRLARTLLSLGMAESEIEEGWHRMLRRNPGLGRRVTLQEVLSATRRTEGG